MVRGITRQVVVVKSPETNMFEQAIFLLREDALEKHGVSEGELLEEARRIADNYVLEHLPGKKRRNPSPLFWIAAGAAPISLAWLCSVLM